jgi:hypothetical protein
MKAIEPSLAIHMLPPDEQDEFWSDRREIAQLLIEREADLDVKDKVCHSLIIFISL